MIDTKSLKKQKATLISYLLVKLAQEDWHGVRDCCVDIEVIEAKLEILCNSKDQIQ